MNDYEFKYWVALNDEKLARDMSLADATLFMKALFDKYYADPLIEITISREEEER